MGQTAFESIYLIFTASLWGKTVCLITREETKTWGRRSDLPKFCSQDSNPSLLEHKPQLCSLCDYYPSWCLCLLCALSACRYSMVSSWESLLWGFWYCPTLLIVALGNLTWEMSYRATPLERGCFLSNCFMFIFVGLFVVRAMQLTSPYSDLPIKRKLRAKYVTQLYNRLDSYCLLKFSLSPFGSDFLM